MSTSTTPATTPATSATIDGASFAAGLARLRQVGKGRPVTLDTEPGGFRMSVRVTARDSSHGAVSVHVAGAGDLGNIIMAAGVTDLTFPDGPLDVRHGDDLRIGPHVLGTLSPFTYDGATGEMTARIPAPSVTAPSVTIPAGWFATDAARVVGVAAPAKDIRRILTGAFVEVTADGMTITATDSYRLHVVTFPGVEVIGADWSAIVPAPFLARVMREAKRRGADSVTLSHDAGATFAHVAGVMVAASDIEGQYPDRHKLFPVVETWLDVPRAAMLDALADITARAKGAGMTTKHPSPLVIERQAGDVMRLTLAGEWGEVSAVVEVPADAPEVERMGVNLEYFRQAVEAMPNDAIRVGIVSPLRPLTFDPSGANVRALLMPVKLPG